MSPTNNQARPGATRYPADWSDRDDSDDQPHTVLLIRNGRLGSSPIWTRVRPLLDGYGLRVLAFDQPGTHRTTVPALDLFDSAAALAEALDERQTSPTVVVAHSLGAGVALALAALAPPRVRALVLIAPVATPTAFTPTGRVLAARRLTHGRRWRNLTVERRRLITGARLPQDRLGGITCPAVIVSGKRDRLVKPRSASALAKRLPASRLIRTDAGHRIPTEDPDIVVAAVLSALRWQYQQQPCPANQQASGRV
jgi:pimeloyl-ACP methyl ester carboxylesterase